MASRRPTTTPVLVIVSAPVHGGPAGSRWHAAQRADGAWYYREHAPEIYRTIRGWSPWRRVLAPTLEHGTIPGGVRLHASAHYTDRPGVQDDPSGYRIPADDRDAFSLVAEKARRDREDAEHAATLERATAAVRERIAHTDARLATARALLEQIDAAALPALASIRANTVADLYRLEQERARLVALLESGDAGAMIRDLGA